MAVTETRVLPAAFIEAGGKTFLNQLSKATFNRINHLGQF